MSIDLTLDVQEFADLVERNRFSRITLTGIESAIGRYVVIGKLRRPMAGARFVSIYSKRQDLRSFKTLTKLLTFCCDELGIKHAEINIEEIREHMT